MPPIWHIYGLQEMKWILYSYNWLSFSSSPCSDSFARGILLYNSPTTVLEVMLLLKIPSGMEVALHYKLLARTLSTLFVCLYLFFRECQNAIEMGWWAAEENVEVDDWMERWIAWIPHTMGPIGTVMATRAPAVLTISYSLQKRQYNIHILQYSNEALFFIFRAMRLKDAQSSSWSLLILHSPGTIKNELGTLKPIKTDLVQ